MGIAMRLLQFFRQEALSSTPNEALQLYDKLLQKNWTLRSTSA
jgi:hypothetical protein